MLRFVNLKNFVYIWPKNLKNMGKYTVYLRRNKVNGKCYVGQTSDFKQREYNWRCLKYYYTNDHICNDRAKYGLDNWTVEVLATTGNREDAWELEKRFINDFNALWPNGYNLDSGGVKGKKISDVSKQKMSKAKKGKPSPMKGKHLSNEAKQKMSESKKGKNNTKISKQVYQYTLDDELVKIWPSVMECHRNDFNSGAVSQCCNGKLKAYKGYRWSYTPL